MQDEVLPLIQLNVGVKAEWLATSASEPEHSNRLRFHLSRPVTDTFSIQNHLNECFYSRVLMIDVDLGIRSLISLVRNVLGFLILNFWSNKRVSGCSTSPKLSCLSLDVYLRSNLLVCLKMSNSQPSQLDRLKTFCLPLNQSACLKTFTQHYFLYRASVLSSPSCPVIILYNSLQDEDERALMPSQYFITSKLHIKFQLFVAQRSVVGGSDKCKKCKLQFPLHSIIRHLSKDFCKGAS